MMIRRKLKLYSLLNYCPTQIAESENVKIYDRECVCWWCLAEERERERGGGTLSLSRLVSGGCWRRRRRSLVWRTMSEGVRGLDLKRLFIFGDSGGGGGSE